MLILLILFQDSNIGIPDIEGKTPLHWAASSKDPEAVNCVKMILVSHLGSYEKMPSQYLKNRERDKYDKT